MKFLQIHTFYPAYLTEFYERNPHLASATFDEQIAALVQDGFSASHMFAPYMRELGYDSQLAIANCPQAQVQWLEQNAISDVSQDDWIFEIARQQVEVFKPDILYLSNPIAFDSDFIRRLSYQPSLIVGWRAASIPPETDWTEFDVILSNHTGIRQRALELGAKSTEYFMPGFPAFIAETVKDEPQQWDVIFSGQVSPEHIRRLDCLKEVAKAPLGVGGDFSIGYFMACIQPEALPTGVQMHNQGARWGIEMYRALKKGRISLNIHIDVAKGETGNMRMFETTGVGSFLLTDDGEHIRKYFEPGVEIETFRDNRELIKKIYYYLEHPEEREAIARRGQERCLKDYSMSKRAAEFDQIIKKYMSEQFQSQRATRTSAIATRAAETAEFIIEQALAQLNAYQDAEALSGFENAIALKPEMPGLNYGKAVALARLGHPNQAVDSLHQLLAVIPSHKKARLLLKELRPGSVGELMQQAAQALSANNIEQAFNLLSQAKSLKQPTVGLDYLRATCFIRMNQPGAALQSLHEELRYFPDNTEAKNLLNQIIAQYPQFVSGHIEDAEFQELLQVVRPYTMLSEARLYSLFHLAKLVCLENIPGNFVECGVAGGGSTALMAAVIKRYTKQPRWLYAFDSFDGMPSPTEQDKHNGVPAEATGWGTGTCAAPEFSVHEICSKLGVSHIVKTVKGYFQDTLPEMRDFVGMIALLHMDGDWYESTKTILNNLYDRVVNDGFIQVDDYGYWEGCRQAVHEFEASRQIEFDINQLDETGVWFSCPDQFPLNPDLEFGLVAEFAEDDPVTYGVQSQMSVNERFQLYYTLRQLLPERSSPLRFVEIGSFAGSSLFLTCQALKRMAPQLQGFAVEPGGHPQFYEVLKHFQDDVTHLQMFSHQAAPQLKQIFEQDGNFPPFMFIDGDHSYEGVRQDILNYFPLLAPGGIMLFHDYLPPLNEENQEAILFHHGGNEPGIRQACQELMEKTYRCEVIDLPLLYPTDPTQSQACLPIIPGVFSTIRAYRKPQN
jgi:Flp pilus assembly protein TadD